MLSNSLRNSIFNSTEQYTHCLRPNSASHFSVFSVLQYVNFFYTLSQELITDTDAMLLVLSKVLFSLLFYLTQLFALLPVSAYRSTPVATASVEEFS